MKKKADMVTAFFKWIEERESIWRKKELQNLPPPWTEDKILQEYKFTNVFRNKDRVTRDLWTHVFNHHSALLDNGKRKWSLRNLDKLLFQICLYRLFNLPNTFLVLGPLVDNWNYSEAKKVLDKLRKADHQIFTGAYMVHAPHGSKGQPKHIPYLKLVTKIWNDRHDLLYRIEQGKSMRDAVAILSQYKMIGNFIAYEIACDLRWTPILDDAIDINTWANPGPGAKRGLNRVFNRPLNHLQPDEIFIEEMKNLLVWAGTMCKIKGLELREIEHSLCEFDKYMRVKNGEGRPRSKYHYDKPCKAGEGEVL
jgi:hypothetical protein